MIEMLACFLSFDDWHYKEWHETLPLFIEYNIKATFYIAFNSGVEGHGITSHMPDDGEWRMLHKIDDAGHMIGYHTWQHKAAKWFLIKYGKEKYMKKEIYSGLTLFNQHGFDIKHFSYPHGSYTKESNELLFNVFNTLRTSVVPNEVEFYDSIQLFPKALDIHEPETLILFKQMIKLNKIIYLFAHNPQLNHIKRKLKELFQYGKDNGVRFYSMDLK